MDNFTASPGCPQLSTARSTVLGPVFPKWCTGASWRTSRFFLAVHRVWRVHSPEKVRPFGRRVASVRRVVPPRPPHPVPPAPPVARRENEGWGQMGDTPLGTPDRSGTAGVRTAADRGRARVPTRRARALHSPRKEAETRRGGRERAPAPPAPSAGGGPAGGKGRRHERPASHYFTVATPTPRGRRKEGPGGPDRGRARPAVRRGNAS